MTRYPNHPVTGDRALGSTERDKLGFRQVAKQIASSLVDRASGDGLVIGVEGVWGSGKSSLLFLISDELESFPTNQKPTVIDFRPWLIGNRDALIKVLFDELSTRLDEVALNAGDRVPKYVAKAKAAGEALRKFVNGLSRAGDLMVLAGDVSGLGHLSLTGKILKSSGEISDKGPVPTPLSELKEKLVKSLRELGHRFIITIDDVDRLEPGEVIEVLRLVRSVVDLPNVIYLLCYDSNILAHSIEKAAGVEFGHAYLEKIVQLTVMVPKPETFQLRQWFSDDLLSIASPKDEDELYRLKQVIDYEGGRQLRTPRSVIRTLDAIRFFWPPLREMGADLADLVWLQLIKDGNPKLYRWIEDYCGTAATVSLGTVRVDGAEKEQKLGELISIVGTEYFDDVVYRHMFAEQLPGVKTEYSKSQNKFAIFERVYDQKRDESIRKKRLASPDHYRLYFALANPAHALTEENFRSIWAAAETSADLTAQALLRLYGESAVGSLTKADLLLERIKSDAYNTLAVEQRENILIAFSNIMDDAYRLKPFDDLATSTFWDRSQRLIPTLLSRLGKARSKAVIAKMFRDGAAIGWLTSILRYEASARGRDKSPRRSKEEWLFENEELDTMVEIMCRRYGTISPDDFFASPRPLSLLFAWRQWGDEESPVKMVNNKIVSDEGLVETLERLTNTVYSSEHGQRSILRKDFLSPFMDYDKAREKIYRLKKHKILGARAKRLASAFGAN